MAAVSLVAVVARVDLCGVDAYAVRWGGENSELGAREVGRRPLRQNDTQTDSHTRG